MHMYRYPHLSCELLTCEVEAIINSLSESEQLMGMLWAFLDRHEPLNPLLGRCAKCMYMYIQHYTYMYTYWYATCLFLMPSGVASMCIYTCTLYMYMYVYVPFLSISA